MSLRIASIRKMDISNGEGVGVSIFTQGCPFHCKGCFNPDTWNYDGGTVWSDEKEKEVLSLIAKPHITRLSLLGGEPLLLKNVKELRALLEKAFQIKPDLKVWAWTGTTLEYKCHEAKTNADLQWILKHLYRLIDGPFQQENKDVSLKYCGSTNQRVLTADDISRRLRDV